MHADILKAVIDSVRRRVEQGDCPTEPAHTVEVLENAVLARATPKPPVDEPWPGYTADQDRRRVETLAKLGLMLSVMAGGEAPEVTGFDAADLYGEVLMALAIEDAEDVDIALQDALDDPEGHMLIGVTKPPVDEAMREADLDWRGVAELAGLHGIRYRTNTALVRFLNAIRNLTGDGAGA